MIVVKETAILVFFFNLGGEFVKVVRRCRLSHEEE